MSGVIKLYLYFYTGLLPFISFKETHLEIPLFSRDPKTLTRRQRWFFWIATAFIVRPSLFRHLEKRGIPVSFNYHNLKMTDFYFCISVSDICLGVEQRKRLSTSPGFGSSGYHDGLSYKTSRILRQPQPIIKRNTYMVSPLFIVIPLEQPKFIEMCVCYIFPVYLHVTF